MEHNSVPGVSRGATSKFDEPALQRKKRVAGAPATTLSHEFFEGPTPSHPEDEYFLLGNREKFSENIKYRFNNWNTNNPTNGAFIFRDAAPPKKQKDMLMQMGTNPLVQIDEFIQTEIGSQSNKTMNHEFSVKKSKDIHVTAPVVDTTKFKYSTKRPLNHSKRKLHVQSNGQAKVSAENKREPTSEVTPTYGLKYKAGIAPPRRKGPKRLSEYQREFAEKKLTRPSPLLNVDKTRGSTIQVPQRQEEVPLPAKSKQNTRGKGMPNKATTMGVNKKSIPLQEVKKQGHTQPNRNFPAKMSEYQREFEWKQANRPSPLLNAEKATDGKQRDPEVKTAPKAPVLKNCSEFVKSEQTRVVPTKSEDREKEPLRQATDGKQRDPEVKTAPKAPVLKNCSEFVKSEQTRVVPTKPDDREKEPWRQDLKDKVIHKQKRVPKMTEYQVAFNNSNIYKRSRSPEADKKTAAKYDPTTWWLQDFMEMREKAAEYRSRSRGTHFSKKNLLQLMADDLEYWDSSPVSSLKNDSQRDVSKDMRELSPLEASEAGDMVLNYSDDRINQMCNVTSPKISGKDAAKQLFTKTVQNGDIASDKYENLSVDEPDQESEELTPSTVSRNSLSSSGNVKPKPGKPGKPKQPTQTMKKHLFNAYRKMQQSEDNDEGRISTPTLRYRSMSELLQRHHLDRTTPSVGGALLTSPPSCKQTSASTPNLADESSDTLEDVKTDKGFESDIRGPSPVSKIFEVPKVKENRTFGKPSYDSHDLRDEYASEDRPLVTRYVDTPIRHAATDFHLLPDKRKCTDCPRPSFVPPTRMADTKPDQSNIRGLQRPFSWSLQGGEFVPRCDEDDDILSISARSVASSSSLASAVLERAKKRQQNVWG